MTRFAPLWQQGGSYPAAVDRGVLSALWPASGSTCGPATTVANTMTVSVPAGVAAVALAANAGTVLCRWDAAEVVNVPAAPPAGQSRVDVIVLQVRDNALDAGANNDFIFQCISGAPSAGTPAAPAVPNNAYALVQFTTPGGAANLNGVTLTDRRRRIGLATVGAHIYQATPQALPNLAFATVNFDSVAYDPYGLRNANSLVLPPGLWLLNARTEMGVSPSTANIRFLNQISNYGAGALARGVDQTTGLAPVVASVAQTIAYLPSGGNIIVEAYHEGAGSQNTAAGQSQTFLQAALLGSM
jgi:hypothetical protein